MNKRALKNHLKYIVPEYKLALIKESGVEPKVIRTPDDVERVLEPLKHYAEEHFVSLHLDGKHQVVGYQIVSRGTLTRPWSILGRFTRPPYFQTHSP